MIHTLSRISNKMFAHKTQDALRSMLFQEAQTFLTLFYANGCETPSRQPYQHRLKDIKQSIFETGTYTHTRQELEYGAQVAWRNNTRCIGRLLWRTLEVRDCRTAATSAEICEALVKHLRSATNSGRIRSTITIFASETPRIRIWNAQLLRYAGYSLPDGTILGDPANVAFTATLQAYGWQPPPRRTPFDLLPVAIQIDAAPPTLFSFAKNDVLEIALCHPEYPWFSELGLKWYAVPIISNMRLEIGGLSYPAAPFNGWYMGTEIGARNLGDVHRYNQLPRIAHRLGLNTISHRTLWKDRALVELNIAVLDSFSKSGVTIIDHHTAARQFVVHEQEEKQHGRDIHADWGWIVPPMSGSTTPVFHREYVNTSVSPNFFYQPDAWSSQ